MQTGIEHSTCALCESPCGKTILRDSEKSFCCHGCQAVFQILASIGELDGAEKHPIFQEALKSGLISNPELLKQKETPIDQETKILSLEIENLWCPSCADLIRLYLSQKEGISTCVVDYATDIASIQYSPRKIDKDSIFAAIKKIGYQAKNLTDLRGGNMQKRLLLRLGIVAFFVMNLMMFSFPIYGAYLNSDDLGYARLFSFFSLGAALPVVTYGAWPIYRRFFWGLRFKQFGMETLVTMGVITAFTLSVIHLIQRNIHVYFDSMAMIIFLVLVGKVIESKAKFKAKDTLFALSRALPRKGRKCFKDGFENFVPLKEIQKGDTLKVCVGERVPLDGVVTKGSGSCDESMMTGEALPVTKKIGDQVLAGTVLKAGPLYYKVLRLEEGSALQRIISMIKGDMNEKSHEIRIIDSLVRYFVPAILFISFSTAIIGYTFLSFSLEESLLRAITILLISCPCAIGVAVPLVEAITLNLFAKKGMIIRNRRCLSYLGKEDLCVFDKTGSLTKGEFRLLSGLSNLDIRQKRILKSLSQSSHHPLSQSISQAISEKAQEMSTQELVGKGVQGEGYYLGSRAWMKELGVELPKEEQNMTVVYFSKGTTCLTTLVLGDELKKSAKEVVKHFNSVLLSGDGYKAVQTMAKECGISKFFAEYNPLEKQRYIQAQKEKGAIIMMLGDGINDAPALSSAHIGVSVVNASDLSIEISDVLLTKDDLTLLIFLKKVGIIARSILKQNLFWAFIYNIIGVGLAIFGVLNPIIAASAMVLSSLCVLGNSTRLLKLNK